MTELELAALKSLLQGTMNCSDMINLSYGFKNYKLAKVQISRMKQLMDIYNKTNFYLIDKYEEITYFIANFEKLVTSNLFIENESKTDWMAKIILNWEKWAESAIDLYEGLYNSDSSQNKEWWKYLCKLHKKDLNLARNFKKELVPENYELPLTTRQRLQAKINNQKQTNSETE